MKECKILMFRLSDNDFQEREQPKGYTGFGEVWEFPKIEKFLAKYLNEGFSIKSVSESAPLSISVYMERES